MKISDFWGAGQGTFDIAMLPRPEGLRLLLEHAAIRQDFLDDPVILSAMIQAAERHSGLSCAEVEVQLAAVIDAEASGTCSSAACKDVLAHIYICPWCYDVYALTRQIIHAQSTGELPPWPQ